MTKKVKRKEVKFTLPKMPKISKGVVGAVLAIVLLVGVGSVSADYSLYDRIADIAGKIVGNKIAENIGEGEVSLGAFPGGDIYNRVNLIADYTSGGRAYNASSTLYIARTITASEFCDNSFIHVNSDSAAGDVIEASLDLTFPATSTLFSQCLNYRGAEKTITFRNNSLTAATSTEIIAGEGCDARIVESTGADDTIEGLNEARITIRRTTDAYADGGSVDCIVLIEETVVD